MKRLILFDVDDTIVKSTGAGRRAIQAALCKVFRPDIDLSCHPLSGKTDIQICQEVLAKYDINGASITDKIPELLDVYLELLQMEVSQCPSYRLLQGVKELVEYLHEEEWAYLGLLTGNVEAGARIKLRPFEMNHYFPFGAYGSDSVNRMHLPPIAHERADRHYSLQFSREEIVIIGDAENDIKCAKGYNVKSICVNTGHSAKEDLLALAPDYFFPDLADAPSVVAAIRN